MEVVAKAAPVTETDTDLRNSVYEGVFANMYATLTGGVFLTGFALHLGMDEFMIGILASMPFLVTIFQWPTSHLIETTGKRKVFWCWGAALARLMWAPILITALLPVHPASLKFSLILGLIFLSHSCNSVSGVSWLSLMSDMVPGSMRGRFFGNRNMLCGAAGMAMMLGYGKLLDVLKDASPDGLSLGFSVVFISAIIFGIISMRFLLKVSEPVMVRPMRTRPFLANLALPFRERNFRKFLLFALVWGFSVHFAAPFFTVFFLQDLQFSYGFVAALGTISGFADLLGMRFWGRMSDTVKNKAVIRFSSSVAICIPFIWIFVRPGSLALPVMISIISGLFWAGINLCMSNLLLGISPKENRSLYFSTYSIIGGLGAATGPIVAGSILKHAALPHLNLLSFEIVPLHFIFLASTLMRLLGFQLFRHISEPEEAQVGQLIRVLRSVRGINIASGFNYLLHPFTEIARKSLR
ncbi:MAG: MFS transporter [Candidatus Abyssobacteria bacterium SURF_5]|uniref:MFS transporter n=1 Tax=Abyssobacteria bacterium (strain SURF_5) TaxID=2093360 RepID=A0A3A4P2T9_ABYX5|nr:MAG: MFS transporter [Candidatus Abyssubacteria bacterium SURF_5]